LFKAIWQISSNSPNHFGEDEENNEHPDCSDDVEEEVSSGGSLCVGICSERSYPSGDGGSDVFTENDGGRDLEHFKAICSEPAVRGAGDGDGEGGR